MIKHYYEVGYRLNNAERKAIKDQGFHIYATRSWDSGTGCTLEHRVIVNHETDVVTDFPALDDNNPQDYANNFYEHMNKCEAEEDYEFGQKINNIIQSVNQ